MTLLWLPGPRAPEDPAWPTLGGEVCDFIEEYLVYGPGDLQGQPYRLTPEQRGLIECMYEIYPDDAPPEQAGRRRYKRVVLSLPKGLAKTELAALIAICEASSSAPVRTLFEDGRPVFDGQGRPVATSVAAPYIPMVAYTEEQTEDLAYGAARYILEHSGVAGEFDIGLERITRLDGGEIRAMAGSPSARDGARTSFQHFDETHHMNSPRLVKSHQAMLNNIPKRRLADAWTLETTTAYAPGEGSIAEATHEYARRVNAGEVRADGTFFYFHRQAGDQHDLTKREGRIAALREASGRHGGFRDLAYAADLWDSPNADRAYWERVWLNRPVQSARQAFPVERWKELERAPGADGQPYRPAAGAMITLGFDGSRFDDGTALEAVEVSTGFSWNVGYWQRPVGLPAETYWEVPRDEVEGAVTDVFQTYQVWRLNADPPKWEADLARWAGRYGADRVVQFWTTSRRRMAHVLRAFHAAIVTGEISHDGDPVGTQHLGNAMKVTIPMVDDNEQPLWLITKDRPDSPNKIDRTMAKALAWEGRLAAIASGVLDAPPERPAFLWVSGQEES